MQRVRDALEQGGFSPRGGEGQISARCPAHDDRSASLSVGYGTRPGVLGITCHAGCDLEDVLAELGLRKADLFDNEAERRPECDHGRPWLSCDEEARYDYTDASGMVLYTQRRYRCRACGAKTFMPYNPATGKAGLPRGTRVLYNLPLVAEAVAAGEPVYVTEGERDADRLTSLGHVATTAANGAKAKWEQGYTDALKGADVVVIADNDDPGREHARKVAGALAGVAASVRVVRSPLDTKGADVSDHLDSGLSLDELVDLDTPPAPSAPAGAAEDPATAAERIVREAAAAHGDHHQEEGGKRGPSQASQLVALARKRYQFFMSEDGRPYGVKVDGPNIALPLRGKAGLRSQLARIYTDESGGAVPSQSALADAMTVLEGIAAAAEPRVPHLRVARHGESIVVDLGTPDGRCVIVGPHGWQRAPRSPVLFRRSGAMKPLPDPVSDGDGLARLRDLINTDQSGFELLAAWLVAAFLPDLPHPILTFRGEQGTGKSKGAQMVIGIIDPSGAPKRTAPRDMKSWATQAFNSWGLCLDNVSVIPDWLSDALCRAVTGDGVVDRALYSDDDVVVLEFRRVLAMTTIDAGALAGDLAERLLTIELSLIPDHKRREEAELDRAYAEAHASILASLFDLLSEVLRALPGVELTQRPRMADFARVLAAVDQVRGWRTLESYKSSARDAVADVLEGEPFAQAVVALVVKAGAEGLTLTAQQLLDRIEAPERLPKKWPRDSTRAGGYLKRLAPALRTVGIEVDDSQRQPKGNRSRLYRLTASESARKSAPAAPTAPAMGSDQGERAGADDGASTRTGARSTRTAAGAGAAGARAGAEQQPAPADHTLHDQRGHPGSGAAGGAGAGLHPLSNGESGQRRRGTCRVCGEPMTVLTPGQTTHPNCGEVNAA
jgi:5S rRNA maturation endonuclease (ribonuclease M5)